MKIFNSDILVRQERILKGATAGAIVAVLLGVAIGLFMNIFNIMFYWIYIGAAYVIGITMKKYGRGVTLSFSIVAVALFILCYIISRFSMSFLFYLNLGHAEIFFSKLGPTFKTMILKIGILDLFYLGIACYTAFYSSRVF
ncbi:MAG: hypothetical protein ACK5KQ_02035 [Anaerorhabdus sp.]